MFRSISSAISAHESTDTHEAASSMPRGKPSTSVQMRRASARSSSSSEKPGIDLSRALDEEAERAGAPVPVLREAEAVHVEHPFALHVETLTRRRQQLDLRRALDDLPQQVRAVDKVLEVVEHEQRRALAQIVEELFLRREAAVGAVHRELDRLGNRRRQELRRRHRDEGNEVHAVRVALDPARGGLERESRLARPARPDEREQAAVGILEQPVDLVELRRAADERRAWGGQVLHARLDRLQQREVAREPVDLELVDALRRAEILEAVHAQVADTGVDERARRLGEEHLPSMADGGDARALVHVDPDVSLLRQPRLTRVQPHAHPDRAVRERALAVRGGGDCIGRAAEGDEERVTLRVHLDALVVGKRRAESPPMLVQCLAIVVAELVQQPRRAFDVREQQRHHAGREIARHRTRSWRDAAPLSSAGHDNIVRATTDSSVPDERAVPISSLERARRPMWDAWCPSERRPSGRSTPWTRSGRRSSCARERTGQTHVRVHQRADADVAEQTLAFADYVSEKARVHSSP